MGESSRESEMTNDMTLVIFAILATLGLIGVVVVEGITMPQHQADATGCKNSIAFNASHGRCFHG